MIEKMKMKIMSSWFCLLSEGVMLSKGIKSMDDYDNNNVTSFFMINCYCCCFFQTNLDSGDAEGEKTNKWMKLMYCYYREDSTCITVNVKRFGFGGAFDGENRLWGRKKSWVNIQFTVGFIDLQFSRNQIHGGKLWRRWGQGWSGKWWRLFCSFLCFVYCFICFQGGSYLDYIRNKY